MKALSFLLLCMVCLSCGKKTVDPVNCDNYFAKYQTAITAYSSSQTPANCLSVKSALSDIVNRCTILTAQQRADYNAEINAMNCN